MEPGVVSLRKAVTLCRMACSILISSAALPREVSRTAACIARSNSASCSARLSGAMDLGTVLSAGRELAAARPEAIAACLCCHACFCSCKRFRLSKDIFLVRRQPVCGGSPGELAPAEGETASGAREAPAGDRSLGLPLSFCFQMLKALVSCFMESQRTSMSSRS